MDTVTEKMLRKIAGEDVAGLIEAAKSYGDSWKQRGGIGAFMMLARKWDRIEHQVRRPLLDVATGQLMPDSVWNILIHGRDTRKDGIRDDIRDLRRYLMLVEAELRKDDVDLGENTFLNAGHVAWDEQ